MTTSNISQEARGQGIQEAVDAAVHAVRTGQGSSYPVHWREQERNLPLATVNLDLTLLNPHSHRIKAYIQSLEADEQNLISSDPFSTQAQEVIARVLAETEGYPAIRNTIERDGQREPGIMTSDGVLVNGNTRAVALRELRRDYIKVLVLPDKPTPQEIVELELRLQMQADIKQEYSLTGQLLLIEDLINAGRSTEEVGRAMRRDLTDSAKDQKTAIRYTEQELRLLGLIRRVIEASNGVLRLRDFDDRRQALIEIDGDYESRAKQDPAQAVRVRDAQLAAMITGVDYRKLRNIDATLIDDYLETSLRERRLIGPHVDALLAGAGQQSNIDEATGDLDLFDDPETDSAEQPSLAGIYSLLATTSGAETVALPDAEGGAPTEVPRTAFEAEVNTAFVDAIQSKTRDAQHGDDLVAPMSHLHDAARSIDRAAVAYNDVKDRAEFDQETFRARKRELERAFADFLTMSE